MTKKSRHRDSRKAIDVKSAMAVVVLAAIITSMLTYIVYYNFYLLEKQEIRTDANFTNDYKIGFNLDSDAMHFGKMPSGGSSERFIVLKNNRNRSVGIRIYGQGEISKYMLVEENEFFLGPGESRKIRFAVMAPNTITTNGVDGKIIIEIRRKLFWQ